jgi:N utilization substance protein B
MANKKSPRHLSRILAMQGIYLNYMNPSDVYELEESLKHQSAVIYKLASYELMHFLLENGINNGDELLKMYSPFLKNRELDEITAIEKAILIIAACELKLNLSVPATVIINEAIELAKNFGASDSYKFVNGMVDKLAHQRRANEISK